MDEAALLTALVNSLGDHEAVTAAGSQIRLAIAADPALAVFDNHFHYLVFGWIRATHEGLAQWLIGRATVTSAEQAVRDLARYVRDDHHAFADVMILGGVVVDEIVPIVEGLELRPFDSIRAFGWAGRVLNMYRDYHDNYQPSAAVLKRNSFQKAILPPGANLVGGHLAFTALDDVRRCMTAIGPSCPVWLGTWAEIDEAVPTFGSAAAIPNPFDTGGFPREPVKGDWGQLPKLYRAWQLLAENQRRRLRVPLDRVNLSLRNVPPVDSAIELGIAIDALFLAEREADRGEQTLTLRLRAARFLANSTGERQRLAKVFGSLYRLRSIAVHSGQVPETLDGLNVRELIAEGTRLTAQAASRVITEGEPDWTQLLYT